MASRSEQFCNVEVAVNPENGKVDYCPLPKGHYPKTPHMLDLSQPEAAASVPQAELCVSCGETKDRHYFCKGYDHGHCYGNTSSKTLWRTEPSGQPDQPIMSAEREQLVIDLARELYDRFVMGGWDDPKDAYPQIRAMLRAYEEREK